jgi:hypothetical protein
LGRALYFCLDWLDGDLFFCRTGIMGACTHARPTDWHFYMALRRLFGENQGLLWKIREKEVVYQQEDYLASCPNLQYRNISAKKAWIFASPSLGTHALDNIADQS